MKIKEEYKGKTIITYDSVLGQRRIEVDKIHPAQFKHYQTMGIGYIFEAESVTISYKGIEEDLEADVNTEKEIIKKPVRTKPNPTTTKRKSK
tara:strand:- start:623 stop:898 length:276 start_codon:yes stop_codon:yes gene_type:complete